MSKFADMSPDELKPWKTAQAECLLAGFHSELMEADDGQPMLIVSRWALCRSFATIAEVRDWIGRLHVRTGATE